MSMDRTNSGCHGLILDEKISANSNARAVDRPWNRCYIRCMARRRRRHEQQTFLNKSGTKVRGRRGGRRKNAGRKPNNGVHAGMPHEKRPRLTPSSPLHVTLRVLAIIKTLRDFDIYPAFQKATMSAARFGQNMADGEWFRIVHLSIQSNHVHLLVEASSRAALARGMQSFQISAAKWINRAVSKRSGKRRRGSVFADRYHAESIKSPLQARRALSYVLNNWRKHERDRTFTSSAWRVDPFSSGVSFTGWKDLADRGLARWRVPDGYVPLTVLEPTTWLLRVGWRKHGLVPCAEPPSARMFEHPG
jgi:REP element-mobilizing transposase RayT